MGGSTARSVRTAQCHRGVLAHGRARPIHGAFGGRRHYVGSCPIPAGKKVYLDIQSANHDEERWGNDSRTYRVDRPNASGHLSFGRGIHACIGAPLARIEARFALSTLLDRYPNMTLAPGAAWVKCEGALIRRVQAVPVLLTGNDER
ncbi:cytochrome P450 [Mycolicibacterium fortuitum]